MIAAWRARVSATVGGWLVAIGALLAVFFTVYLRGQASAKADAKAKAAAKAAAESAKRVDDVLSTAETVAKVRSDILVTPGAKTDEVARNVGEALKNEPKSLQGRLGAMARDAKREAK